jgi:TRAP-type C4-dicarboxylate transport system permease small subunit
MREFGFVIKGISVVLYWISCAAVACIVCLTVFDVIMRRAGHPVDFAVEIVILLAGVVIACAFPATSLAKDHVIMEFIEGKLSGKRLKAVNSLTRLIGIALFVTIGFSAFKLGNGLRNAGQCSPILQIPEFPLPYVLGIACFVECLVLLYMLLQDMTKEEEQV